MLLQSTVLQLEETAGKQGRKDVMATLKRFRAYEGETEGGLAGAGPFTTLSCREET
jgi:hypothetical protein